MRSGASGVARGSLVAGIASCATLPLAIYSTRFSDRYDLLHAGFAIPVAAGLAVAALVLARRARMRTRVALAGGGRERAAMVGHILGVIGLCMAAAALVALGVYGLLEYVGSRD